MAKIRITETVLGESQKALLSSRMPIDDVLPALKLMDRVGYHSIEVWDRDSYIASMQYLNEDPWQRLKKICDALPKTRKQMSFSGQYLFGSRPFSNDVVEFFIQRAAANGIDVMRIFDPLNDSRNMESPIKYAREAGVHVQAAVFYTESQVHNSATFLYYARALEKMGADSICLIDNAGLLDPYTAYTLIAGLKQEVTIPIQFSSPDTTGSAYMSTLKAIEAGADIVDTAISPFSGGFSRPATEAIVKAFKGSPYDSDLDLKKLQAVEKYFSELKIKYLESGLMRPLALSINPTAAKTDMPYEMLDYLTASLAPEQMYKIQDVFTEAQKVRENAGSPPLVFPTFQGIVQQSIKNVFADKPYTEINKEFFDLVQGLYGSTPASIDPVFRSKILGDVPPMATSPSCNLTDELEDIKNQLPERFKEQPEDTLTLAMFPLTAPSYFERRSNILYNVDGKHSDELKQIHPV